MYLLQTIYQNIPFVSSFIEDIFVESHNGTGELKIAKAFNILNKLSAHKLLRERVYPVFQL